MVLTSVSKFRFSVFLLMVFCTCISVFGQVQLTYRDTTGKVIEYPQITINDTENGYEIITDYETALCDKNFNNLTWSFNVEEDNINIKAVLNGNSIHITGEKNGKPVDKVLEKDAGIPWFQMIYDLGPMPCLSNMDDDFVFCAINPNDLTISKMRGFVKKESDSITVNGETVNAVFTRISMTGLAKYLWSADYWFRADGRLLCNHIRRGFFAALTVRELILEEKND